MMNSDDEFVGFVVERLQLIGPVYARRMFGGHGLFLEEKMFALIADATLYFKVNGDTEPLFIEKGLQPFTYQKKNRWIAMQYYQAPEDVFDDDQVMMEWANSAYSVALRAAKSQHGKKQRASSASE